MSDFLIHYHEIEPTTWVYLSSLLTIGLFFKFGRFWSVRNLDVVLLILLAPGLVLVHYGQRQHAALRAQVEQTTDSAATRASLSPPQVPRAGAAEVGESTSTSTDSSPFDDPQQLEVIGFVWLFAAGGLLLARLLLDPTMVRRPLLDPNLSLGGLTFIGCALFVFLMANVIKESGGANIPTEYGIARVAPPSAQGPGYALLGMLPPALNKTVSILAHLAVVLGMALVGYRHFGNLIMGIGSATLYLLLPYTAFLTGRIDHVLPASLLVGAVLMYRRPVVSGTMLGLASGTVYYPFFLLPLWLSFYWHRGFWRFLTAFLTTLTALALVLILSSNSLAADLRRMFGLWPPVLEGLEGIWNPAAHGLDGYYRLPILAAFVALSLSFALWPAQKNLGTLLSCSAAVMVAAQFWHGYGGGTYMAWYLPLTLLTIFRPNLEDRVALTVLSDGWLPRLKGSLAKAA